MVVDIKFKMLPLNASGDQILNGVDELPDKAQVFIYNRALVRIQEYLPARAFLLGRGWQRKQSGIDYRSGFEPALTGDTNPRLYPS